MVTDLMRGCVQVAMKVRAGAFRHFGISSPDGEPSATIRDTQSTVLLMRMDCAHRACDIQ